MAKKMSLNAWINSQLKNKGLSVSQAKKNAGKYKSISAAKKAGSLYYTNKDGKVMIAAYAEDLKMPVKKPDSVKKIEKKTDKKLPEVKIIKKTLPTPQWYKDKKIKEQLKTISDIKKFNNNVTAYNALSAKVKPRPKLRIHVDAIKNQQDRKEWDRKYGKTHNRDGTLKNITIPVLKKYMSREEYFSRNRKK
tara:strand:- start:386 stop:961 length:576 start_codon:yes stop_codon:yes gene_type:complete